MAESRHAPWRPVDTLLEIEADVRLFIIGKRGEHADFAKGHLGRNLERMVRAVRRTTTEVLHSCLVPVLLLR